MAELKIGYRAVFFDGEEMTGAYGINSTYEGAKADIRLEHERVEEHGTEPFTYAKVEMVYYRH